MKTIVHFAAIAVAGSFVGGCATSSAPDRVADDGIDHTRVASVERASRGRGVDIHWVNFPQRRVSGTSVAAPPPVQAPTPGGG